MARATSAASPGPGSGTRTCPRPSSVMSKIFGLTSEQRPWPWQRLASMDSGTCGPLSYHVRLHAFLHEHVDEATSSRGVYRFKTHRSSSRLHGATGYQSRHQTPLMTPVPLATNTRITSRSSSGTGSRDRDETARLPVTSEMALWTVPCRNIIGLNVITLPCARPAARLSSGASAQG
jgi:hypothetical protein